MKKLLSFLTAVVVAPVVFAFNGVMAIPDVRVAPLLQTHWGQTTDTGYSNLGQPCFNLYTPQNMPCGCTATAMAQILRYWQYPASAPVGDYLCLVNGQEVSLPITTGAYDWERMPLDTRDGVSLEECEAIGKLTYDCALVMHTMFASGSSFAFSDFSFSALTGSFGYANAMGYCPIVKGGLPFSTIKNAIFASLDAGSPVMASLVTDDDAGHQILIDGYGFADDGTPYVHILFGWPARSGSCDCWYDLPNVNPTEEHVFTRVDGIVYNIFPNVAGDVLSGRVLDEAGKPVVGASVTAVTKSAKSGTTVVTGENGVYAFLLPGDVTYTITCGKISKTVKLAKSVSADCSWKDPFWPSFTDGGTCGNSWGNDLVLTESGEDPVPPPVPPEPSDDFGPFNPTKAVSAKYPFCGVVRAADGSICGTISLKVGKASKKKVSKVSGTVVTLGGKKYTVASTSLDVNEFASVAADGIVIKKLGTMSLKIGERGFSAVISTDDAGVLTAETADMSFGLVTGEHRFSVTGLPERVDDHEVFAACTPDGELVKVSDKGKWQLNKAASIKYKKISVKDPETGKKVSHYELQGLDDDKKPNRSGLKLTYTAKSGTFKGSFYVYYNKGTEEKPKLAKQTFSVNGIVVDGRAVGLAVCKKLGLSVNVSID